jgi:7,8-dihydropterin-6-yl-methyl-4-(beta-D-ribofuranosyl)aminobenzene 5'-phosphate synthase
MLNSVDKVEIITLEDNYIELTSGDSTEMVRRAAPLKGNEFSNSILAEHGFSSLVKTYKDGKQRAMLFDFGLSEDVAIRNAEALNLDLCEVEASVLSHGHIDHFGGIAALGEMTGKKDLELIAHPSVFKSNRFILPFENFKITMPSPEESKIINAGFNIVKTEKPYYLLENHALFLGEIPRTTSFEQGMPNAFFEVEGESLPDLIEDDSAVIMNLSGKGLIVLSGCAHSGIVNTVKYARQITGIQKVHAVMGGFHLSGPLFEPIIGETVDALKELKPDYIIPTHCTGRKAIAFIEREMPESFILNMAGTTITFV